MERTIVGFRADDEGDWVADLSCGHGQHVRHRPPFELRPWVLEPAGRAAKVGTTLDCALCDRCELPPGLHLVRQSPEWDEESLPGHLRRPYRLAPDTWGDVRVGDGWARVTVRTDGDHAAVIGSGESHGIPPGVEHTLVPVGRVRLSIDYLAVSVEQFAPPTAPSGDEGGEAACMASLVCPQCGAVSADAGHVPGCSLGA